MELTIFTPTYNRRELLERLYNSLLSQPDHNFEWLVIDDGSTDETESWISSLSSHKFVLNYYKQNNCGKHIAINNGASRALGEWFFIVDSDDFLTEDAIKKLKSYIKLCNGLHGFAGFCTNRVYTNGQQNGKPVTYDVLDSDFISYSMKHKYDGEHPPCLRTSVWREFPFPSYPGEKFCSEALILRRMAKKYKCRYFNDSFYIMEGYLRDGLTSDIKRHFNNSPRYSALLFKEQLELPSTSIKYKIATIYNFWKHYSGISTPEKEIKPSLLLRFFGYPIYLLCNILLNLHK